MSDNRINRRAILHGAITLVGAQYDTMDPMHMQMMSQRVQKGQYLYCPEGSHFCLYDDQQVYFEGLVQFVRDVESGRF